MEMEERERDRPHPHYTTHKGTLDIDAEFEVRIKARMQPMNGRRCSPLYVQGIRLFGSAPLQCKGEGRESNLG